MWPSSHSSCSRTSTQSRAVESPGPSRASTSEISALVLLQQFAVGRHGFINDSGRSRHSRLPCARCRAAERVRLLVAVDRRSWRPAAVAGVVARDAAGSAAAEAARCKQRPEALIVPGVPSPNVAAVRAARSAQRPKAAGARCSSALAAAVAERPGRPVQPRRRRSSAPATSPTPGRRSAQAKKVGRDTSTRSRPTTSCTRSSSSRGGVPDRSSRTRREPAARSRASLLQRAGPPALRRAALRARRAGCSPDDAEAQVAAAVGRFDEDNLVAVVLAPRPARRSASRRARPCATTSACCSPGRGSATQAIKEFRLRATLGPTTELGKAADDVPAGLVGSWDQRPKR